MNREQISIDDCSILTTFNILSKKWTLLIITELITTYESKGRKGMFFSEIQKNTFDKYGSKISSRVLSDCLQNLESDGLISRTVFNDAIPVRVEYSLTEKGYDFKVVLSALKGWGTKYGGLKQKLCLNFTCLHNAVPILNIDKAWDILDLKNDSTNESNSQD